MRDSTHRPAPRLTHSNTKRKMHAVGPWVAADSESNLRTFRIRGAQCAAPVASNASSASSGQTLARRGQRMTSLPCVAALVGDDDAPPGSRHRRFAPEWA